MSTADLARKMAAVATALEPLTHLPDLRSISTWADEVIIRPDSGYDPWLRYEPLAQWAYAFDAPIEISLDFGSSADIDARFELAGHPVRLTDRMNTAHAYQLGAELQTVLAKDQPLRLTAAEFQTLIGKFAGKS
jgi:hypothetical protein